MVFGTFAGPVQIEARMGSTIVSSQTVNTNNAYQNIVISNPSPFSRLLFKGGHNEAILVRICVDLYLCDVKRGR
jgi:hypothetical protein